MNNNIYVIFAAISIFIMFVIGYYLNNQAESLKQEQYTNEIILKAVGSGILSGFILAIVHRLYIKTEGERARCVEPFDS